MLNLKCECGNDFKREEKYKDMDFVLARWKMRYCNNCLDNRVNNVFKNTLPKLLESIADDHTTAIDAEITS